MHSSTMSASWTWCSISIRCAVTFLTIHADADPVTEIRFMPFWTRCSWREKLKKRAKTWSCPDWRLWRSSSDIAPIGILCTWCSPFSSLRSNFTFHTVTNTLLNSRALTYDRRSPRADAKLCIARSQIHFLLTCTVFSIFEPSIEIWRESTKREQTPVARLY
jgi:hypothetical protein